MKKKKKKCWKGRIQKLKAIEESGREKERRRERERRRRERGGGRENCVNTQLSPQVIFIANVDAIFTQQGQRFRPLQSQAGGTDQM